MLSMNNMISIVASELLQLVQSKCPCRQAQIQQLATLYNQHLPSPSILVVHGLRHTGKLPVILTVLEAAEIDHVLVKSSECLTQRHLLSKIFATCIRSTGMEDSVDNYDRIDSINSLVHNLRKLLSRRTQKLVLVMDGIDKQRGGTQTLLPALARLGDYIQCLSVIMVSTSSRELPLQRAGVGYLHFTPYTRNEAIHIMLQAPPPLQPESLPEEYPTVPTSTLTNIYGSFVAIVYDALVSHTASTSLPAFRSLCEKLWPRFIWPMLSNEPVPNTNSQSRSKVRWDFARLLSRNRPLFQQVGEAAMNTRLAHDSDAWTFAQLQKLQESSIQTTQASTLTQGPAKLHPSRDLQPPSSQTPLLKFFPTLLLLSAHLASHTLPKHDIILFSRLSSSSTSKRRYLASTLNKNKSRKTPTKSNKTSASATAQDGEQTPSKRSRAVAAADMAGAEKEKTHRSSKLQFEKTSSIPKPFTLERLVAVLRAVHPDGIARTKGISDRVYGELAELERLRLVVRLGTSAGTTGDGGGRGTDDGILEEKWRINVTREVVVGFVKVWGLGIDEWEIE